VTAEVDVTTNFHLFAMSIVCHEFYTVSFMSQTWDHLCFYCTVIWVCFLQAVTILKGSLEVTMIVRYFPYGEPHNHYF